MATVLFLAANGTFSTARKEAAPATQSVPTVPPDFKNVEVKMNRDVLVLEARIDRETKPATVAGSAKNVSNRRVLSAEIAFELTDKEGSQDGGLSVVVENLAPQEVSQFRARLPIQDAAPRPPYWSTW